MIDIHSHILAGLDDGAKAFEVSLEMVEMARRSGTSDIVATPHANASYAYESEVISDRIEKLQRAAEHGIRIHRGCDFHLSPHNIQAALQEPSRFAINGFSYLLVEFPEVSPLHGIEQVFQNLMSVGLTPIVTHPERNEHLAADIPRLRRWVEKGIYLQVTAQSLLGKFGSDAAKWCLRMIGDGQVHFVASDAHDLLHRPPRLDEARDFLRDKFSEECSELLLQIHPQAVIEGLRLGVGPLPCRLRERGKWFHFGVLRGH